MRRGTILLCSIYVYLPQWHCGYMVYILTVLLLVSLLLFIFLIWSFLYQKRRSISHSCFVIWLLRPDSCSQLSLSRRSASLSFFLSLSLSLLSRSPEHCWPRRCVGLVGLLSRNLVEQKCGHATLFCSWMLCRNLLLCW